jgi:pimeloyl-ACP methyl ester carboxylesterase
MRLFATLVVSFALAASVAAAEPRQRVVALETRPGVHISFYLNQSDVPPAAAVILLSGGEGLLKMQEDQPANPRRGGNFLVRSRGILADRGLLVATVNAPSDLPAGMSSEFRLSADHATDLGRVADWLRQQAGLPVWLAGTSMGTLSAAGAGIRLGSRIDGVVLASTITRTNPRWTIPYRGVLGLDLETLTVPLLVVGHRSDSCWVTPADDIPDLMEKATASPRKEARVVSGGSPLESAVCEARSPHGFVGLEDEVVAIIAGFILAR